MKGATAFGMGIPGCYNQMVVANSHIKKNDEKWMRLALEQALLAADLGEVPVGAVAVWDEQVIGLGFNQKEARQDPTVHAEMVALQEAASTLDNWRLIGVTLYSTLEPCPMCAGAMIQGRLERLVYAAKDIRFGADGSVVNLLKEPLFNHQVAISNGILEKESATLLQSFFKNIRAKEK